LSKKLGEFVTLARIRRDQKFEDRISFEFDREALKEFLDSGLKYASAKRDKLLNVLRGDAKMAIIWFRRRKTE